MSARPEIPQPALLEAIRQGYGLPVTRITFLTDGWVSHCYKVETSTHQLYLLKVYEESPAMPAPLLASSRDFYLPLSYRLCTRQLLPQIACPVPTEGGSFTLRTGPYLLILFHFIAGEPVGYGPLSDDIIVQLAGLVGRLHRSTRGLQMANPLVEQFEIAFEDLVPVALKTLAEAGPGVRAGLRTFQVLVSTHRTAILTCLDRLKALQSVVRLRRHEFVVCHTDLHGGNLLLDRHGDLHILDWEGAMLSPPEQDLFFFAGEERFRKLFWPAYEREAGPTQLDIDTLGFYCYRRGLEDLTEWAQRFLHSEQDEEHERKSVYWAEKALEELADVEAKLATISAALSA
jgi:Ser/Thr protein kinase RdoA (MazF antagonist)